MSPSPAIAFLCYWRAETLRNPDVGYSAWLEVMDMVEQHTAQHLDN